jgi:tetratricopeptide (TPR) repeat protein
VGSVTVRSRAVASLAVAAALAVATGAVARRVGIPADRPYDVKFVPSPATSRWLSLGHPTLAANLEWLRVVQYVGDERGDARGWSRLRPLLDLITSLDPKHAYAYQVGANALTSAGLVADADAVLERGARNVPDRYILPFHRAVNAFLYEGDFALAGRWFEAAARTPGAPPHLREYVLAMYVKGDTAEAAISFLHHLEEQAGDPDSRRGIQRQIQRATVERDAIRLERAMERFRRRVGVRPVALEQLVAEGLVAAIPPDPFGGVYYIDADGRVRSSARPDRFERPPADRGEAISGAYQRLKAMEGANR